VNNPTEKAMLARRYHCPVKRICTVSIDKSTLPESADPWPMTVEAESVFEAALVVIQKFSVTRWANQMLVIEVRSGEDVWRVSIDRVSEWNPQADGDMMAAWRSPTRACR
jgi:hypothetical protein